MDLDEQDAVWRLLNKAPRKKASGAFVSNVVRQARLSESGPEPLGSLWNSLFLRLGLAGAAIVAIVASLVLVSYQSGSQPVVEVPAIPQEVDMLTEELQVMTIVDELLAVNDPSQTLDDAGLAELLFFQGDF